MWDISSINVSCARLGNSQLLEAALACDEVFPTGGGSDRSAATEFHFGIFGGEISVLDTERKLFADMIRDGIDEHFVPRVAAAFQR